MLQLLQQRRPCQPSCTSAAMHCRPSHTQAPAPVRPGQHRCSAPARAFRGIHQCSRLGRFISMRMEESSSTLAPTFMARGGSMPIGGWLAIPGWPPIALLASCMSLFSSACTCPESCASVAMPAAAPPCCCMPPMPIGGRTMPCCPHICPGGAACACMGMWGRRCGCCCCCMGCMGLSADCAVCCVYAALGAAEMPDAAISE
mmetsp:Transcript_33756/g.85432  ORF Transcript_33756/g.85432 Transcript_33756/m.85432 type:complete len:202 (+) Transcript_33756:1298-1903(+)